MVPVVLLLSGLVFARTPERWVSHRTANQHPIRSRRGRMTTRPGRPCGGTAPFLTLAGAMALGLFARSAC